MWLFKRKDIENRLYFNMKTKLDLTDFKINIIKYGREIDKVKIINRSSSY